jgi:hypothetical protein
MSAPNVSPPEIDTTRWYAEKVARHGYDHRGLGFRTRSSQEKRFEALLSLGDFHERTVLDVGCGVEEYESRVGQLTDVGHGTAGPDVAAQSAQSGRERVRDGL